MGAPAGRAFNRHGGRRRARAVRRGGQAASLPRLVDLNISPLWTVKYYERVVALLAASAPGALSHDAALYEARGFARLILVSGMGHSSGGPWPDRFDGLAALEHWMEEGVAPKRIVATKVGVAAGGGDRAAERFGEHRLLGKFCLYGVILYGPLFVGRLVSTC